MLGSGGIISISMWSPTQEVADGWRLRGILEQKLVASGVLPQYQKEWESLLETSITNANTIDAKNIDNKKMFELLSEAGFEGIQQHDHAPYGRWAYFITATKQ